MRKWIVWSLVAVVGLAGLMLAMLGREHQERSFALTLADGRAAQVRLHGSQRRSFGGHAFHIGGGDHQAEVQIDVGDEHYAWSGTDERPVVVDAVDGRLYLVLFRPGLDVPEAERFVVLVASGEQWRQVPLGELPPAIARQNVGFGEWEQASPHTSLTTQLRYWLDESR